MIILFIFNQEIGSSDRTAFFIYLFIFYLFNDLSATHCLHSRDNFFQIFGPTIFIENWVDFFLWYTERNLCELLSLVFLKNILQSDSGKSLFKLL